MRLTWCEVKVERLGVDVNAPRKRLPTGCKRQASLVVQAAISWESRFRSRGLASRLGHLTHGRGDST